MMEDALLKVCPSEICFAKIRLIERALLDFASSKACPFHFQIGKVPPHQKTILEPWGKETRLWRLAREHWGNGYAFEAASKVIEYAFQTLKLSELVSFTTVENQRSRKLMERLGMTRRLGDDFEHSKLPKGHPLRPHVLYRLKNQEI